MPGTRRVAAPAALACAALLCIVPSSPAAARQALVLSGGGARGLAHVGVLLWLAELGHQPDLVIGTSMGAVVGALYAAGYHPQEIRERVLDVTWSGMFDPTPVAVGPARDARLPILAFDLGSTRQGVNRGLFGEWRVNRTLVHLLFDANVRARGDFDRLARRFRAVAVDLTTGEKVVLGSGDLARATRASMSYPGFFAPVRWGERILIDGGVVDNLPTADARRLGATHVIAVDVGRPPDRIRSLDPLSVSQRALDLMVGHQPDSLPPDVLVQPIVNAAILGAAFPDDPVPLIELGSETARRELPPPHAALAGPASSLPPAPDRFAGLRIEATDSELAGLAERVFAPLAPGPYDAEAVLAAVDRLYATGLVEGVWPRLSTPEETDGEPVLIVRVEARSRLSLSVGAGFDNDRGGRAWLSVDHLAGIGGGPAVLSATVSTDGLTRWAALAAQIHALAPPTVAWTLGTHVQEHTVRTFSHDTATSLEVLRAGGWLGVELPRIRRDRTVTLAGRAELIDPEGGAAGGSFGPLLRVSSMPDPTRIAGVPLLAEAEARWGAHRYRRAALALSRTFTWHTVQVAALADLRMVSSEAPQDVKPALGDQHAVPGLRWGDERGRARAVTGIDIAWPAPRGGFFRLQMRTGAVADRLGDLDGAQWISGGGIGLFWRIPLGVLEAGYGRTTNGRGRFDVSLGRGF